MRTLLLLLLAQAALLGCRSVELTPRGLREEPTARREAALRRWAEAVDLANGFLASPYRRTLPRGEFLLAGGGMTFVTPDRSWPIRVRSTTWGDLTVFVGFRAQERADGFVVGSMPPDEDPLLDNSFFRGSWFLYPPRWIAELILHETTHTVYYDGTVGPWNTFWYYVTAAATLRSTTHPAEDRPRATTEEFDCFFRAREGGFVDRREIEAEFREHLATEHDHCRHGP